ncbi:hypothetical protein EVAR_45309_1 [Eumeta japonica]|uniref:Uncharacterized protein n=1 Tax=Eumeta variegata TaxID=151549 RepID=A0A4C1XKE9_EUMVA|nr:hypothetical protein EVAR_45309_1 [Eumeta japonica]
MEPTFVGLSTEVGSFACHLNNSAITILWVVNTGGPDSSTTTTKKPTRKVTTTRPATTTTPAGPTTELDETTTEQYNDQTVNYNDKNRLATTMASCNGGGELLPPLLSFRNAALKTHAVMYSGRP